MKYIQFIHVYQIWINGAINKWLRTNSLYLFLIYLIFIFLVKLHAQDYIHPGQMWADVLTNEEMALAVSFNEAVNNKH